MTQQLSLFAESATDQPTEDTPRARWDKRLNNPSTSSGQRLAELQKGGAKSRTLDRKRAALEDYETVKLAPSTGSGRRLGREIDDVMQQYVQRAHQIQVLRRRPPRAPF